MTLSIDRRADLWTDRVAAIGDDGTEHSYRDLADDAADVARRLIDAGVGEGDPVALLARNSVQHFALLFACRRLGAVLAPISHRLGPDAVAALGERIEPALVLHDEEFDELAAEAVPDDAAVDGDAADEAADDGVAADDTFREDLGVFLAGEAPDVDPALDVDSPPGDDAPPPGAASSDAVPPDGRRETPLLYLHTGGTTGVPKVVVITRRQVEWNCVTEAAAWGLGADDVAPVLLPLYHTGGWHLLTLPLLYVGGRVVVLREFDPGDALAAIEEHGATRAFAVAAIFRAMADHDRFEEADLSTLEWCMSGGGPTPAAVIEAYRERGVPFVQGYGLTEGGPNDLYFPPDRADEPAALRSVGRPFPDCDVRLVDPETGEPVGADGAAAADGDDAAAAPDSASSDEVRGELELRGPVTARRYLETEDGTFDGDWVSTGDLAVRRPAEDGARRGRGEASAASRASSERRSDGDYEIVGRTDNMFVSGGENVYPEEIEDPLERHPDVAAAGVLGVPHERWGTVPKAVIVPEGGVAGVEESGLAEELEAYLDDRLAGFQVPDAWAFAEELPRSGPGKLDRDALERVFGEDEPRAADDAEDEPRTDGGEPDDGGYDRRRGPRGDGAEDRGGDGA